MVRVLQLLTGTALGGGPRQVLELVRHLPANEFRVCVAGPWDERFATELRVAGVELADVAVDSLRAFPVTLRRVGHIIRTTQANVVHTHGKGAGLYGRLAAKLAGVPAVHTFHGIHYESYSRSGQRLYLALERALARITHTVVNVSKTQDEEARRLGVAHRSAVVVNGIDVDELQRRTITKKEDLGLSQDSQVVGCVARFDPVKKHEVLVKSLAIVTRRHPRVVLLLAGEGPEKARISQLAAALKVRMLSSDGATAWSTNLYRSCDLYVSSSSKEGLPLAPLEAMASELPVVATDVPGHRDVVKNGETGLLVAADNAEEMAAAIESLLDDPELRRRMGRSGAERVRREFTLQSMVAKTAEVYRAAAASRPRREQAAARAADDTIGE